MGWVVWEKLLLVEFMFKLGVLWWEGGLFSMRIGSLLFSNTLLLLLIDWPALKLGLNVVCPKLLMFAYLLKFPCWLAPKLALKLMLAFWLGRSLLEFKKVLMWFTFSLLVGESIYPNLLLNPRPTCIIFSSIFWAHFIAHFLVGHWNSQIVLDYPEKWMNSLTSSTLTFSISLMGVATLGAGTCSSERKGSSAWAGNYRA